MTDADADAAAERDVPDEYDAESFRSGYAAAMQEVGLMALESAAALRGERGEPEPAEDDDEADDDEPAVCPDCGASLLSSMGADAGVTPAGQVCPACEL